MSIVENWRELHRPYTTQDVLTDIRKGSIGTPDLQGILCAYVAGDRYSEAMEILNELIVQESDSPWEEVRMGVSHDRNNGRNLTIRFRF